jgi:hypothetical protein
MEPGAEAQDSPDPPPPGQGPPAGRSRGLIARLGLTLLRLMVVLTALVLVGLLVLRLSFNGAPLGKTVAEKINAKIAGHVVIESIEWPIWAISDLGRVPLVIRNVRLYDPHGRMVLAVPRINLTVDAGALLASGGRSIIAVDDVIVTGDGSPAPVPPYVLVAQSRLPYPFSGVGIAEAMAAHPGGPAQGPGTGEALGMHIEMPVVRIVDTTLDLDFPGWQAGGERLNLTASVFLDEQQQALYYDLHGTVDTGHVDVGGQRFPLHDLVLGEGSGQVATAPDDVVWAASMTGPDDSHVWVSGAVRALSRGAATSLELLAGIDKGGKLAARYLPGVEPRPTSKLTVSLSGPVSRLHLDATVVDVNVQPGGRMPPELGDLHLIKATLGWDLSTSILSLEAAQADLLGGLVSLSGRVTIGAEPSWDLDLTMDPALEIEPFLPPDLRSLARGGELHGKLHLVGDERRVTVDGIDLVLGTFRVTGGLAWVARTETGPTPTSVGWALAHGVIKPQDLEIEADAEATKVRISRGEIDLMTQTLRVGFSASIGKLVPWLRRLGVRSRLATSATVSAGELRGTFAAPLVEAQVAAHGVPFTDGVEAHLRYSPGTVTLSSVRAHALGGLVLAGGRIRLGRTPRLENAFANGRALQLGKLPHTRGVLGGEASFGITLLGPITRPAAAGTVVAQGVTLGGEPLGDLTADLETDEHGLILERLELEHDESHLLGHGTLGYDRALDLTLSVRHLPVASLPGLSNAPGLGVDGNANLELHATGTIDHPDLAGALGLSEIAFGQTLFGAGNLDISMAAPGVVALHGSLFQGKISVAADVQLLAPHHAHAVISFERLELDEFTTAAQGIGLTGWATGQVKIAMEDKLAIEGRITELRGEVVGEDSHGRPVPVAVHNEGDVVFTWDGVGGVLTEPAVLLTSEGKVTIAGKASPRELAVQVDGEVALGLLEGFTHRYFDSIGGAATIKLAITGTPEAPRMNGAVTLRDVELKPRGVEAELAAPTGQITFANDRVRIDQLTLALEGHTLDVSGELALRDYAPDRVDVRVHGRLAARLLSLIAGRQISDASGSAAIDLGLTGTLDKPRLDGDITFDQAFSVSIRGLRREVEVKGGKLAVHGNRLSVDEKLVAQVDDGSFTLQKGGTADISDELELTGINLDIDLSSFVQREAEVYEVEINARNMTLTMVSGQLFLGGDIDIVDGRFLQKFNYTALLTPQRTQERQRPFYEGVRLLETMQLGLHVHSNGGFVIDNNLTPRAIALNVDVQVTGTLPDPRFAGQIKAASGQIHLATIKPTFDIDDGTVTFRPDKEVRAGAEVNLSASSTYIDASERSHRVHLLAHGPLSAVTVTFSTEDGLNSVQTLALITLGKTDEQFREQYRGDSASNANPDLAATGAGASNLGGAGVGGVADRVIKDFAADILTTLVGDLVRDTLYLDCFTVNVGIASASVYGCKRIFERLKVDLQYEYGYTGVQIVRPGIELRLQDHLSLRGFMKFVNSTDPLTEEVDTKGFELKFRWIYY